MPDLVQLTLDYQEWKVAALAATGLARDALHIHVGLAAFIITRLVWRWRFGWLVAWVAALAFALGGEWFDIRAAKAMAYAQPDAEHWHDIWNTMVWPTVLALIGRWLEPKRASTPGLAVSGEDADQPLEQA